MPEASEVGRKIINRISDGFMSINEDLEITYVNEEAVRIFNRTEEEMVGEELFEILSESKDTKFAAKCEDAIEHQETVYFEHYSYSIDSWFSVNIYPSNSGISLYIKDITARKEDGKRLKNNLEYQKEMRNLLRMVIEEEDLAEILHEAARIVSEGLENEYSLVLQKDKETSKLLVAANHGINTVDIGEHITNIEEFNYVEDLFEHKGPICKANIEQNTEEGIPEKLESIEVHSVAGALVGEFSDPWGVIVSASRRNRMFREAEEKFVQNIANIVATAVK